jgi:valine--pyruvate aminotransferase
MLRARSYVKDSFGDTIPYRLHESEGAFFLWFWFPSLPITTIQLYEKLKERNVLVVPGEYFFFGLADQWDHSHECIRVTFSQSENIVKEGIQIIADEVAKSYGI